MKKVNRSLTTNSEIRFLNYIAAFIPSWISSDLMTLLSLLSLLLGGIFYFLAAGNLSFLLLVNLMILINWFSDGLDGKLAYFRKVPRPNYGFYIDHLIDSLGVIFLLGGLGLSTLVHTPSWIVGSFILLVAFIHSFLKVVASGQFDLSVGIFSPTDARIGLVLINFLVFLVGNQIIQFSGLNLTLFDLFGWLFAISLGLMLIPSLVATSQSLEKKDRL